MANSINVPKKKHKNTWSIGIVLVISSVHLIALLIFSGHWWKLPSVFQHSVDQEKKFFFFSSRQITNVGWKIIKFWRFFLRWHNDLLGIIRVATFWSIVSLLLVPLLMTTILMTISVWTQIIVKKKKKKQSKRKKIKIFN